MHGEIITIGNELISGKTQDTNTRYIADRFTASGLSMTRITCVGDDPERVSTALLNALSTARFVIITGGLGPTDDDITNEIVADVLNRPLCLNRTMIHKMRHHAEAMGITMNPSIEKMAWIPEGARVLNPEGPECGCCIEEHDVPLYFLPGIPGQMRHLLDTFVLPELLDRFHGAPAAAQRVLKMFGNHESDISEAYKKIQDKMGKVSIGFYPHFPENHLTLNLTGKDRSGVERELDRVETLIRQTLGDFIFASGNMTMEAAAARALLKSGKTISVAESCTGGLIGHRLTNIPGSSTYFQGGAMVYSNQAKMDLLQVDSRTLAAHGAVSDPTVREMVKGVRARFNSDMGLAVTGIAGPDGGTAEKPVGTVFLGISVGNEIISKRYGFHGSRERIKQVTAAMALDWIRRILHGSPLLPGV